MNKTKIEWADSTWNPVTGCLHGCRYCYARDIATRFKGFEPRCGGELIPDGKGTYPKSIYNSTHGEATHVFYRQPMRRTRSGAWQKASYPYGFEPTLHSYKLDEFKKKRGRTIFVCSMGDLFGEFIPSEWIKEVLEACFAASQHRYLFLTKNPKRYQEFEDYYRGNMWLGMSYTHLIDGIIPGAKEFLNICNHNIFMSLEPILEPLHFGVVREYIKWAILGAESGNRNGKIVPKSEWIEDIVNECRYAGIPVFMKYSLIPIVGEENMIREFPW